MKFFKQISKVTADNDVVFLTAADAAICLDKSTPGLFSIEDYLVFTTVRKAFFNSIKFTEAKQEIWGWKYN